MKKEPPKAHSPQTQGGSSNLSRMMPVVYDELRRLARLYMRREKAGQTLQATALVTEQSKPLDLLTLDEALERLAVFDPRLARIVELRFFGGLNIEELAQEMELSPATIKRSWAMAKAWLKSEMEKAHGS
jgi:RNA polymerase sigma factor (sigma-70 family)